MCVKSMRAIGLILLFIGAILVTKGVSQGGATACPPAYTHVKLIPRTLYEEQFARPAPEGRPFGSTALANAR